MKEKIVLVDCSSTGVNYVEDILKRGYEPVLVEAHQVATPEDLAIFREMRDAAQRKLPSGIQIIRENEDYSEILRQVKATNPIHIIAASEFGVMLTVRLAHDLGLPGNPIDRLAAMTQKDAMHEALKEHGLRYIRGHVVDSADEAADWYDKMGLSGAVVKRTRGAGTQGVYLCDTREDMLRAVEKELAREIDSGDERISLLIQERINGREYIVNTVSCNGEHRFVSMWEYDKLKMPNGTNAYNYGQTVNELSVGHSQLIQYAFNTVDAIGIKYGPVHGEYMIDEKGPVLIEVNCRPIGCGLPKEFLDMTFGQHETDSALDAYLDPAGFARKKHEPYRPLRKAALKFFILQEDTPADSAPVLPISHCLKSYFQGSFDRVAHEPVLTMTRDLETTGGVLYLLHDDEKIVRQDLDLLHLLEMKYPRVLFQEATPLEQSTSQELNLARLMQETLCNGATLVFSDTAGEKNAEGMLLANVTVVNSTELTSTYDGFEQGILDLRQDESFVDVESLFQQIFVFFRKVRQGGRIIVHETTYSRLPYGISGMEILARLGGFRIEVPPSGDSQIFVATVI